MDFPYVIFWDRSAWVAGTTQHSVAAQGPDFRTTVDRLRKTIYSELSLCRYKGRKLGGGMEPMAVFKERGNEVPFLNGASEPDKSRRYKGSLTIENAP
jgi:hypothetical protein